MLKILHSGFILTHLLRLFINISLFIAPYDYCCIHFNGVLTLPCGRIFMCIFMCILFNRNWCYVPHSCVNECGHIFMCFGFMCILFNRSWCYVPHSCYTLYYLMCCAVHYNAKYFIFNIIPFYS